MRLKIKDKGMRCFKLTWCNNDSYESTSLTRSHPSLTLNHRLSPFSICCVFYLRALGRSPDVHGWCRSDRITCAAQETETRCLVSLVARTLPGNVAPGSFLFGACTATVNEERQRGLSVLWLHAPTGCRLRFPSYENRPNNRRRTPRVPPTEPEPRISRELRHEQIGF